MKVLIADNDRTLADVIAFTFKREGYDIILAEDGETAYQRFLNENPSLIILDINMPRQDGFTVCQRIREHSDAPIILLTVRSNEEDIVHGLNLGADDYIIKPFSPRQLMARVKAVLRRSNQKVPVNLREVESIKLNLNRHELTVDGYETIKLSGLELRLMDCLMLNTGQVVTPEIIIDYVWGALSGDLDMVRQLVHRLRTKIEKDPGNPEIIVNVPGVGYELVPPGT